jgi:uncharacterized protein (TIGR00251 family)
MWYQEREEGVLMYVKVVPGSKRNQIVGASGGDFLKIKITAPPEKGKANEALCAFLAKKFKVSKSMVRIVKGQTQPLKIIFVPVGVDRLFGIIK